MIVKLFDQTSYTVSKADGEKIAQAINTNAKTITIRGDVIRTSAIATVTRGGTTEADIQRVFPGAKKIGAGKPCRSLHSIHKELIRIATLKGNLKLLNDENWKEKAGVELYKRTNKWCDYTKDRCFCYGKNDK